MTEIGDKFTKKLDASRAGIGERGRGLYDDDYDVFV